MTVSWAPSWPLIATRNLELRKRRGLVIVLALLTVGPTVLILGLRLIFHVVDPASYGPAGSPGIFQALANLMAEFGFLSAAALGASAGTTDLSEGMFRHLVITGRSRLALYLARIPGRPGDHPPARGGGVHRALPGHQLRRRPATHVGQHRRRLGP